MVMRNQSNGSDARWWDDLPPRVRKRVAPPHTHAPRGETAEDEPAARPLGWKELFRDLSSIAVLFALATIGIMLYLLLAVSFVTG